MVVGYWWWLSQCLGTSKVKNDVFQKLSFCGEMTLNSRDMYLHQRFASPCQSLSSMLCLCLRELLFFKMVIYNSEANCNFFIHLVSACFPVVCFCVVFGWFFFFGLDTEIWFSFLALKPTKFVLNPSYAS